MYDTYRKTLVRVFVIPFLSLKKAVTTLFGPIFSILIIPLCQTYLKFKIYLVYRNGESTTIMKTSVLTLYYGKIRFSKVAEGVGIYLYFWFYSTWHQSCRPKVWILPFVEPHLPIIQCWFSINREEWNMLPLANMTKVCQGFLSKK